jgi:DNA polymerase-1
VALLQELELPLIDVLAKMERTGIAADSEHFAAMSSMLHGEAKAAEQAAYAEAGHEFNLGSPKQLQELLFNELDLPKTRRIKTGYTTDSEALTSLLAQTHHPVLEHLLRHRDVAKLMTIVDSLIPMAGEDGGSTPRSTRRSRPVALLHRPEPAEHPQSAATRPQIRLGRGGRGYECLLSADYTRSGCGSWRTCPGRGAIAALVRATSRRRLPGFGLRRGVGPSCAPRSRR